MRLLRSLNDELKTAGIKGQINLAGGAVMCLAFGARESTRDVDAVFHPSAAVLDAASKVAAKEGVRDTWLNDGVKAYVSDRGTFVSFLELGNLKVFCASPEYMLAMKCLALRFGAGYWDEEDVRYLLRNLGITRYEDAKEILERYYSLDEFPETALPVLQELLTGADHDSG